MTSTLTHASAPLLPPRPDVDTLVCRAAALLAGTLVAGGVTIGCAQAGWQGPMVAFFLVTAVLLVWALVTALAADTVAHGGG